MILCVKKRTPGRKQRALVARTDPLQAVLMVVAVLAIATLIALDFSFR